MPPPEVVPACETPYFFQDDDSRWSAVASRDAAADGAFVYCVRTTKIFCRPVCKARLARRANVVFHRTAAEASRAGFRACKRCRPTLGLRMPVGDAARKIQNFVNRSDFFDERCAPRTLDSMARDAGLSKWHFHREFKRTVGVTPTEYNNICQALSTTDGKVTNEQAPQLLQTSPTIDFHTSSSGASSGAHTPTPQQDTPSWLDQDLSALTDWIHPDLSLDRELGELAVDSCQDDFWIRMVEDDLGTAELHPQMPGRSSGLHATAEIDWSAAQPFSELASW